MKTNKYSKYIPTYCAPSVYDVDFNKLYENGKRIILTDLDNTLISYKQDCADEKLIALQRTLKEIGFKIYIISNNNDKRILKFTETFKIDGYLTKACKPFITKMNKFIKDNSFNKEEIIYIGDQLVTDILSANNAELDSILVSTIDTSSQKWYTKINRIREKKIIQNINKINSLMAEKIKKTVNRGKKDE